MTSGIVAVGHDAVLCDANFVEMLNTHTLPFSILMKHLSGLLSRRADTYLMYFRKINK